MLSAAANPRALTDVDRLAVACERFLSGESAAPDEVRETILASWQRSPQWNAAADHIELPYIRDPNLDTPLARSALPMLLNLRKLSEGLADQRRPHRRRRGGAHPADGRSRSRAAPRWDPARAGLQHAEEYVGTNGIGTALESGRPAHVFGHEHYAEDFEDLACAATPVHGPISGKMVGAVDLTRWRKDADALLIALAKTTADQITQALPAAGSAPEVEPVQEYLRACRHSSGIVLARNSDMVMMNDYARQVLDPGDQVVLLGQAAEALAARRSGAVAVELPTGAKARIYCRPVRGDGRFGGVVHVKLIESGSRPAAGAPAPSRMFLAGLVGSGPLWLRGCQQVDAAYTAGELLALEGEPGVGKLAVLRAVHQRRNPAGRLRVMDAAEAGGQDWQVGERPELLNGEGSLVIRHVDQLSTRRLHALPAALQEARAARRQQSPWVGARPALEGIRPGCCGSSRAPSSFPAPASRRGPARSCAVLPREAQPASPAGLSRGDAASAPVELAG